jgi:predicted ribonuclease YlaK
MRSCLRNEPTRKPVQKNVRRRSARKKKKRSVVVFDTNALIDDPQAYNQYLEHAVYISGVVINELGHIKKYRNHPSGEKDTARKARTAINLLYKREKHSNSVPLIQKPHQFLPGELIIDVSLPKTPCSEKYRVDWNFKSNDHKLVMLCLELRESGKDVELITRDKDLTIFAQAPPIWLKVSTLKCSRSRSRS